MPSNSGFFSKKLYLGASLGAALIFFIAGIIFWGSFNMAMEATNTLEFCISCHEMEDNVYQEYKPTIHYSNRTGVRATCSDCHVPDPWIHKMVRKVKASNEVLHKVLGTINTKEKFNNHRLDLARNVWKTMKETDSRECRNCHNLESMNPLYQKPRARKQHLNAFEKGLTCIDCHKGIAHKDVRKDLPADELEELEKPWDEYKRPVPQMYLDGLKKVEELEKQQVLKEEEERLQQAEVKKQQKLATKKKIDEAVSQAIENYKLKQAGKEVKETSSGDEVNGFNLNWDKAPNRKITLLYPGQTSIEWVLRGTDHGGANPFKRGGDRCVTCHDKELAEMGEKMVTGQKAEKTPIEGKRGSIPVNVQSTYDDENLYFKFTWEEAAHVPVKFVEGGKMDPENDMKIAIMLATDKVEFADRAGCWGTCHHDANGMPDYPTDEKIQASDAKDRLDLSKGITKYLKESRTKIEVKARRGKKQGGWDKLKSDEEIKDELEQHKFMDILRYKAGTKETEDGYILKERIMSGGQGFEVQAEKDGSQWTVYMKRALKSESSSDLNLDINTVYNFGFAIHDDHTSGRYHHVSLGYRLAFDKKGEKIDITTTKQ